MTAETLRRETPYHGRVIDLHLDEVRLPNGETATLEVAEHPGAAAVVPVDDDGQVLLVRQYRHAAGGFLLEVPAGKLDPNERPEDCARREVAEEVGVIPRRLVPMGRFWTTPGFCDEKIWLYLGLELEATEQALEADEVLSVERIPFQEAVRLAIEGEIDDGKSICALLRAPHYLDRGKE